MRELWVLTRPWLTKKNMPLGRDRVNEGEGGLHLMPRRGGRACERTLSLRFERCYRSVVPIPHRPNLS